MSELAKWDSFYVITGSAAGGLIGLQFVVMTLIADRPALRVAEAGAAFGTPTIVHFSTVLLVSAVLRAPWSDVTAAAAVCGIIGLWGVGYSAVVMRHMLRQTSYRADFADWIYFLVLPLSGYVLFASAAAGMMVRFPQALFGVGAAALVLLFTGIHNAWDSVAWHVFDRLNTNDEEGE